MGNWHYEYEEEIVGGEFAGTYLAYHIDTYDYILNDNSWVFVNDAIDEQDWLLDVAEFTLESKDGEYMYVPEPRTATKLETDKLKQELDAYDRDLAELRSF